jgi:hypothetical protein
VVGRVAALSVQHFARPTLFRVGRLDQVNEVLVLTLYGAPSLYNMDLSGLDPSFDHQFDVCFVVLDVKVQAKRIGHHLA